MGNPGPARALLEGIEANAVSGYTMSSMVAMLYLCLGREDEALARLERAGGTGPDDGVGAAQARVRATARDPAVRARPSGSAPVLTR
jgi:hypothetical protein